MSFPFHFDFAAQLFEKSGAAPGRERRIGGFCSTDHLDQEDEKLIQEGLDFGPFLQKGFFNDNHLAATGKAVGYPELAELRNLAKGRKGWYVEGWLLKDHGPADEIWSFAKSLQGTPRNLGFSVEGTVLERDPLNPGIVLKAVVKEVAITRCPVNTETSLSVLAKSLTAGHAVSNPGATPGDAFALRMESLEGDEDDDRSLVAGGERKKKRKKKMNKSEAIRLLMELRPEVPRDHAEMIVDYALRHYPVAVGRNQR